MLLAGDVCPHVALRQSFATPTESHLTDITQPFPGLSFGSDTKRRLTRGRERNRRAIAERKKVYQISSALILEYCLLSRSVLRDLI